MTADEAAAINRRENGRVGIEVIDAHDRRYWITDVMPDERLRVLGEDGRAYWWNDQARFATLITVARRDRAHDR
jgi:hypothetical protein